MSVAEPVVLAQPVRRKPRPGRDLGAYALDQYTNVKSVWVAL